MYTKKYDSIRPGQVWRDNEGKRIQAHGGLRSTRYYVDRRYICR